MVLLFLDCLEWVNMIFDDDLWMRLYRRKKKEMDEFKKIEIELKEGRVAEDSTANPVQETANATDEKSRYSQGMVTQINYKRTYKELHANYHMLIMMSNSLKVTDQVYNSKLCRLLFSFTMSRLPIYHLLIVSCQNASGLNTSFLILFELLKLIYTLLMQFKLKIARRPITIFVEILQSIGLMAFLFIALLLHTKRFNELVGDSYQDAGIWIIIASCGSEYILLLIYIGIAAMEHFKTRKIRKVYEQRNPNMPPPYLHFLEEEKAVEVAANEPASEGVVQNPLTPV